jgi:nucleotide-binding universal stress UspA family protein
VKALVAIDSSPSSQRVLDAALARPWPDSTTFCLLNVVDLQRFEQIPVLIKDATLQGQELVKSAARRLCGAGFETVTKVILGHPRGEVPAYAREWGADLIIVGSHGHSAIGRFLLGSVAQATLRTAPCSVEIVRHAPEDGRMPEAHGMRILLATDGSDCSLQAVHAAADFPWPEGSTFRVLSVEELMVVGNQLEASSLAAVYPASQLDLLSTQAHERATSAADAAKEILVGAGRSVLESSTPLGEPRSLIIETAKEWPADMIVLGSHGRRGLDRFLMGSVSESVAIHAPCSVRVVRATERSRT